MVGDNQYSEDDFLFRFWLFTSFIWIKSNQSFFDRHLLFGYLFVCIHVVKQESEKNKKKPNILSTKAVDTSHDS